MNKRDLAKLYFLVVGALVLTGAVFAYGVYCGAKRNAVYLWARDAMHLVKGSVSQTRMLLSERPNPLLLPRAYPGDGVTLDETGSDDLVLLVGLFGQDNGARLIRRDGRVVNEWTLKFSELMPDTGHIAFPPATDWNVTTHGAALLPDGSLVFNFEYCGLVKVDRSGRLVWTLDTMTHHSVERAEAGGFWVPGRFYVYEREQEPGTLFPPPYAQDSILRVSEDGEILSDVSLWEIFNNSGLEALVTSTGHRIRQSMAWDKEMFHMNKIAELSSDMADSFPQFQAGDLLVSLRMYNMLFVVDPATWRVKWWKIGPWLRQHDPEFSADGRIAVFNNNMYKGGWPRDRFSDIMMFNPGTGECDVVYGGKASQPLFSDIRGKHEVLANGDVLITEYGRGRALQVNAEGRVVWEYVNGYDEESVGELTEVRAYPADYFQVQEWRQ